MTQTQVIDLGKNNIGVFGPAAGTPEEVCVREAELACSPEYSKPATRRYVCVDGRLFEDEARLLEAGISPEEVDPQLAGGKVLSEVTASYMDDPATHRPESVIVAEKPVKMSRTAFLQPYTVMRSRMRKVVPPTSGSEKVCALMPKTPT